MPCPYRTFTSFPAHIYKQTKESTQKQEHRFIFCIALFPTPFCTTTSFVKTKRSPQEE